MNGEPLKEEKYFETFFPRNNTSDKKIPLWTAFTKNRNIYL